MLRHPLLLLGVLFLSGCTAVPIVISSLDPDRARSDNEAKRLCSIDGGINIFETVQLPKGKFAVPSKTNWAAYEQGRKILDNYRIKKTSVMSRPFNFAIYKYTTWIERTSDQTHLSEMIQYFREGDEVLHGTHCPEEVSEDMLIDKTFIAPGTSDPANLPYCSSPVPLETDTIDSVVFVTPEKELKPPISNDDPQSKNSLWQREHNCDESTKFGLFYEKVAPGETRLTGSTLQFDADSGSRCISIAMATPNRILCSATAIWLVGRKTISSNDDFSIQKFDKNGVLKSEITLAHSNIAQPGRVVGFYESSNEVGLQFISLGQSKDNRQCHQIVAKKSPAAASKKVTAEQKEMVSEFAKWLPGCGGSSVSMNTNVK